MADAAVLTYCRRFLPLPSPKRVNPTSAVAMDRSSALSSSTNVALQIAVGFLHSSSTNGAFQIAVGLALSSSTNGALQAAVDLCVRCVGIFVLFARFSAGEADGEDYVHAGSSGVHRARSESHRRIGHDHRRHHRQRQAQGRVSNTTAAAHHRGRPKGVRISRNVERFAIS